ncbi:MAG: NAD-dependent epimerase/dehydratase family protein [Aquisalimonadaceae bacterium]
METVLITGGAGFIGSHLADELLRAGYRVRALDNLDPQVHGPARLPPAYLNPEVELQTGDVRDPAAVTRALRNVQAVVHLAARVGVGQSMYQIASYTDANIRGTAVLLEQLTQTPVQRLIVASSMSIYGEGLYRHTEGRLVEAERNPASAKQGRWDVTGPDGTPLIPVPTPETKRPSLASIYALTKMAQESMCLIYGRSYGLSVTALRLFNAYGERQALSNPYTGVLAIFGGRLLNRRPPLIFEDGRQRRDFIHVSDVARACRLALETPAAADMAINVASGHSITIAELAEQAARIMGVDIEPRITGEFRAGDIRHCFADITAAGRILGFTPGITLDHGLGELAAWLARQPFIDRLDEARNELLARRLAQ